jgi:diguanylate cyclase (GGDEF)-like protein/PAS domain S-box-containing protein
VGAIVEEVITRESQWAVPGSAEGEAHAARLLAGLARRIAASLNLQETLQLVVQSVGQLGFDCAAMNLAQPGGMFEVVAIVGPDDAVRSLLGTRATMETWLSLLDSCEQWGDLRFLDHRADQRLVTSIPGWVPPIEPSDDPGAWHPDDSLFAPLYAPDGSLIGVLSVDMPAGGHRPDAPQRRLLEEFAIHAALAIEHARVHTLMADSEQLFRAMFDRSPIAIALQTEDHRIIGVNTACEKLLDRAAGDLVGHLVPEFSVPPPGPRRRAADAASDPRGPHEIHFTRPDGTEVWGRVSSTLLAPQARGGPRVVLTQIEDITQLRTIQAQFAYDATHDRLTGLANRALVVDQLKEALDECLEDGQGSSGNGGRVAVLFCDLDHFKAINDTLGHAAGDQLLAEVGRRLARTAREQDIVGRLGGDEFVMICRCLHEPAEAGRLAERVMRAVQQPVLLGRQTVMPSLSLGLALSAADDDADTVLGEADRALYAAKAAGRGQWRLAQPGDRLNPAGDGGAERVARAVEAERDAADLDGPAEAADRADWAVVHGRVEGAGQRQLEPRLVILGRARREPVGHPGQRHPRHAAVSGPGPAGDRGDRRGRHQVPGRVVKDRQRPPVRRAGGRPGAARQGHAGAVLHQGVEAAPALPRPGPAVGVQRDLDESGRDGPPGCGVKPQSVKRARSQAVDEHVRPGQQFREPGPAVGGLQVEHRAALAQGEVAAADAVGLVVVRRVDP